MAETTIRLRPRASGRRSRARAGTRAGRPRRCSGVLRLVWPDATPRTTAELVESWTARRACPAGRSAWTAPARARMDMMSTGVRTPVGVRVVSPDPARLDALGGAVRGVVGARAGHAQRRVRRRWAARRWLSLRRRTPAALARFGVDPGARSRAGRRPRRDRRADRRDPATTAGAPLRVPRRARAARPAPARARRSAARADRARVRAGARRRRAAGAAGARRPARLRAAARRRCAPSAASCAATSTSTCDDGTDLQRYVERARREVDARDRDGAARASARRAHRVDRPVRAARRRGSGGSR